MTEQADLFSPPEWFHEPEPPRRARRLDPSTSHAAAARVNEFAGGQQAVILAALREFGALGAEQIAYIVSLPAYSVRKRLPELQDAHLVEPVDGVTRQTSSGRSERVWAARL